MTSQLRDLAAQIEDVARRHPAYSQAWQPVRNLVDHLCALGRIEETNQTIEAARVVRDTFKKSEDQGYHTRDREFAIDLLSKWMPP